MALPTHLSPTIMNAAIDQIAPLFLPAAGNDRATARQAAVDMLADYQPETHQELALAADVVHYRLHAVDALCRAAEPDLPLNKVLRLRGSSVSLSREAHKAQRKLDQLQRDRKAGCAAAVEAAPAVVHAAEAPAAAPVMAGSDPAKPDAAEAAVMELVKEAVAEAKKHANMGKYGGMTYTQQLQKRMMAKRMAEKAARSKAEAVRQAERQAVAQQTVAQQAALAPA